MIKTEPTDEECNDNTPVSVALTEGGEARGLAAWYPMLNGCARKAVICDLTYAAKAFDVYVWPEGRPHPGRMQFDKNRVDLFFAFGKAALRVRSGYVEKFMHNRPVIRSIPCTEALVEALLAFVKSPMRPDSGYDPALSAKLERRLESSLAKRDDDTLEPSITFYLGEDDMLQMLLGYAKKLAIFFDHLFYENNTKVL